MYNNMYRERENRCTDSWIKIKWSMDGSLNRFDAVKSV